MFSKKKKRPSISAPTNFEHRVHTGFDRSQGKFVGLPPQWASLIKGDQATPSKTDGLSRPRPIVDPSSITNTEMVDMKKESIVRGSQANLRPNQQYHLPHGASQQLLMNQQLLVNQLISQQQQQMGPPRATVARSNSLRKADSPPPQLRPNRIPPPVPEHEHMPDTMMMNGNMMSAMNPPPQAHWQQQGSVVPGQPQHATFQNGNGAYHPQQHLATHPHFQPHQPPHLHTPPVPQMPKPILINGQNRTATPPQLPPGHPGAATPSLVQAMPAMTTPGNHLMHHAPPPQPQMPYTNGNPPPPMVHRQLFNGPPPTRAASHSQINLNNNQPPLPPAKKAQPPLPPPPTMYHQQQQVSIHNQIGPDVQPPAVPPKSSPPAPPKPYHPQHHSNGPMVSSNTVNHAQPPVNGDINQVNYNANHVDNHSQNGSVDNSSQQSGQQVRYARWSDRLIDCDHASHA